MATSADAGVAAAVAEAARVLPPAQLQDLADAVERCPSAAVAGSNGVQTVVATPAFAARAAAVIDAWARAADLDGRGVALALRAGQSAALAERAVQDVDVVWTGPALQGVPVRLTSAVVAEVAGAARERLLLMSFAAYKVPAVVEAIEAACERGVAVDLVLESEAGSGGKLTFDAKTAFGDVAERVRVWEWPAECRPVLDHGHAVLHAKATLADEDVAFVTSANLTGHGLDQNIELGLLVRGGPVPKLIARYVRGLMEKNLLARI